MARITGLVGAVMLLCMALAVCPASATKVYLNPSIQQSNWSPDGTYVEGTAMNDVAVTLLSKLAFRGFEVRNSGWTFSTVNAACDDARYWGANAFLALHTNASAGSGWHAAHGTQTFYLVNWSGYSSPGDIDIAVRCGQKLVNKFSPWGRGYNGAAYANNQGDVVWNGPGDHCLVEALFHDNWDDLQVLKNPMGKNAYAQAVFEATCDHFGWAYDPTPPAIALNTLNMLEVFARGTDGAVWHKWCNPGGIWSAWASLAGNITGSPAVLKNADGHLEIFARFTDGSVRLCWCNPDGSWSAWNNLGGNVMGNPVVGVAQDGNPELFAVGAADGAIYHCWRNPGGAWSAWFSLGGQTTEGLSVTNNTLGRLEVFHRGGNGAVYHKWNNPDNTWSDWASLGGSILGPPVVVKNADGHLEVFVRAYDGTIQHCFCYPNGVWSAWLSLGANALSVPAVAVNPAGRLDVLHVGTGFSVYRTSQSADGSFPAWSNTGGVTNEYPVFARNYDGHLEAFIRGRDGVIYHSWANPDNSWSAWVAL